MEASGFLKFVIETFGNEKDFSVAQAEAALQVEVDTEDEDTGDVAQATPGATESDSSKLPNVCPLSAAKLIFPVSEELLHATSVPREFISDNTPLVHPGCPHITVCMASVRG